MKYCEAIYRTKRWKTREVMVGNVGVGGDNPVRIQSMTTSSTRDIEATVEQIKRLADAGCEIARVTVQGMKEADACEGIKNSLLQQGYTIPVVADIHFFPPAAMRVVDFVDKVRVNPGNFVDKRATFKVIEYDDASYAQEILKIEEKFAPLVEKCKLLKRSMRIGTNHGSLSDRIMNRYGDTPMGMVESALEFARICRKYHYHDFMFSMKASNPKVMIQAYRLLVAEMMKLGWNYPLHLGVTEAGDGEDGRIKSAMGIGSLLLDGLGDTIRVSLTEDPWYEIDPCKRLVQFAKHYEAEHGVVPFIEHHRSIAEISRRPISYPKELSLHQDGSVLVALSADEMTKESCYSELGCDPQLGLPRLTRESVDALVINDSVVQFDALKKLKQLNEIGVKFFSSKFIPHSTMLLTIAEAARYMTQQQQTSKFALKMGEEAKSLLAIKISNETPEQWKQLTWLKPDLIFLAPKEDRLHYCRYFFEWIQNHKLSIPIILNFHYDCSLEDLMIQSGAECGALLTDGIGEGVCIEGPYSVTTRRQLGFNLLQAARMRSSKTDFISCPSCGRTLFNLQEVTARIKERTAHLPGVKIAIMGCIVNGPGEMADADFGYVGSKPGKIDLYVGKNCVEKDIDFSDAVERLVNLIKAHGKWQEPEMVALEEIVK